MKRSLLFVAVMLLGMSNAFGQQINYVTLTGNSTSDDRFYAFSGTSTEDLSALDGENWTYEEWIKVGSSTLIGDATESNGELAGGACIMDRNEMFELYLISDASADFAIRYNRIDETEGNENQTLGTMTSSGLSFDSWIHVAISRSSSDGIAKFYVNGNLVDSSNDALWTQPASYNTWLGFNYMFRSGANTNFFKGSIDNVRVSFIDRYPTSFTPDQTIDFTVDDNTLIQLNLDNNLTAFDPVNEFDKVEMLGSFPYYIKIINTVTWESENSLSLDDNTTDFGIFPNPAANGFVTIQAQNNEKLSSVEVFNTLGKSVRSIMVENNSKVSLDVQGLTQGLYFVKATTDAGVATQKLVIK